VGGSLDISVNIVNHPDSATESDLDICNRAV